ncbi:MAG: hypothetical protein ACYSWQ_08560, partial [Planctomycetota bacterium]
AANCVYRRDLLLEFLPEKGSGYWEAVVNNRLMEAGHELKSEPDLVVRHTGPFTFFYYLGQRFLFSRAFGGIRRSAVPLWYRLAYVFLAPLLVPLLWFRTTKRVIAKGHRVRQGAPSGSILAGHTDSDSRQLHICAGRVDRLSLRARRQSFED